MNTVILYSINKLKAFTQYAIILFAKTTAVQNEIALSYHRVHTAHCTGYTFWQLFLRVLYIYHLKTHVVEYVVPETTMSMDVAAVRVFLTSQKTVTVLPDMSATLTSCTSRVKEIVRGTCVYSTQNNKWNL